MKTKSLTNPITTLLLLGCLSCNFNAKPLPILGEAEIVTKVVDGKTVEEKVYTTIPEFAFRSQYGDTITSKNFNNKIYVADFFFVTCPTICPVMKKNMRKVLKPTKTTPTWGFSRIPLTPTTTAWKS